MLRLVLFALFLGVCASAGQKKPKVTPPSLSRGWGDSLHWLPSYEEGLAEMVKRKKPLMVIHHQDNCPHSQELKKAFAADKSIQTMAKDFVMINLIEAPVDKNLALDGYYVPRIIFVDPSLTVRNDIVGKFQSNLYTYGPADMKLLARNMKKAKKMKKTEL